MDKRSIVTGSEKIHHLQFYFKTQ